MASRILDNKEMKDLQAVAPLWPRYRPAAAPLRFRARSAGEAARWRMRTRTELRDVLGLDMLPAAPLQPKRIERVDKGDYVREKIVIRTSRHSAMPVYLLLPKRRSRPLPVVLAFHGHGYGVKDIVGLWEDGQERDLPDGYHKDFGVALCRAGFAVAAPEISCFGERQTDFAYLNTAMGQPVPYTCTHAAMLAFHLGLSVVGLRVHDGLRLVDYLETRRDLDTARLGAMGISGGGLHTFYSACVDERIRSSVVSGYYCPFRDSILAMSHCACNFVPGLHRFGEIHDLAGLIAPRPMLIEAGSRDPIFPVEAVRRAVAAARRVYRVCGAPKGVEVDYFEGRHQISGRRAYDFLRETLGA